MAEARKSEDEITEWGQKSERESGDGLWGGERCARLRFAGRAVSSVSAGLINARGGKNETFTGPLIFHRRRRGTRAPLLK